MKASYSNTVYNSDQTNERQELKDINNKLTSYFNSTRETTPGPRQQQQQQQQQQQINSARSENNSIHVYSSVRNLEKDLEKLKQLYDEEIRLMRFEIEELSTVKNKYSLENFNLEIKLQDFIEKFEEIKRTNQTLANDLNESKNKNNRLEYEIETLKLQSDNPVRENKQLRKDLDDLLSKLNEKQAISDNEISCRQDIELKYKELSDAAKFEKKLFDQELNKMKDQLETANDSIKHLETKYNDSIRKEMERNDLLTKKLTEIQMENEAIKYDKKQLEDQLDSMKSLCFNLESVISNLETMKKVVQNKFNNNNNNNRDTIGSDEQHFDFENLDENLLNSINEIRKRIKDEENRLKLGLKQQQQIPQAKQIEDDLQDNYFQEELDKIIGNTTHRSNHSNTPPIQQSSLDTMRHHTAVGPILNRAQSANQQKQFANTINFMKNFEPKTDQPRASSQLDFQSNPNNLINNENFFPSPPTTPELKKQTTKQENNNIITPGKDYTFDLFKNFEKTTFLNENKSDEILKSNLPITSNNLTPQSSQQQQQQGIIEASFTGNIKIHEVNKLGYYVRLLNVSNTTDEDLSNFTIQQMVSGMPVAVFRFPKAVKLAPGNTITVWARTEEVSQQPPQTFVWNEQDKWGTGPECTTILAKPNGQAVSWTTGCHKYGNVDYDDIVTVYSHKRSKTASVQLNRKKLVPQTIFTPTKHPHASSTRLDSIDNSNNSKQQNESPFSRSIFSGSKTRNTNSASQSGNQRKSGHISVYEYNNNDDNFESINNNFNYFSRNINNNINNSSKMQNREQTLFKNKIN